MIKVYCLNNFLNLVIPVPFIPCLYERAPLTWHVSFVACRVHHWVGALRTFLTPVVWTALQAQRKPVSKEEVSRSLPADFYVLQSG